MLRAPWVYWSTSQPQSNDPGRAMLAQSPMWDGHMKVKQRLVHWPFRTERWSNTLAGHQKEEECPSQSAAEELGPVQNQCYRQETSFL